MQGKKLHRRCDASNKGSYHHMVKRIAWYDVALEKFESVVIDSDICEGADIDTAKAIDHDF